MAVYITTGKLGGGKTLCSVGRIKLKLEAGCLVATNLDLKLHNMFGKNARNINVLRVPDKPTVDDLRAIGNGNTAYDETKNGLLVLDECGTWFNSRNWNDKSRKEVNDWFLHARKLGWDVILIIQDIELLDSQARKAIAEHTVFCSRLDRVSVPLIGPIVKLCTGIRLKGPRIHSARVVYGTSRTDMLSDRWVFRGTNLYSSYDTKQLFLEDYPHATHCMLTPWHLKGRYKKPWNLDRIMRITKIWWKRFKAPLGLGIGALAGVVISLLVWPYMQSSLAIRSQMVTDLSSQETAADPVEPVQQAPTPLSITPLDPLADPNYVPTYDSVEARFQNYIIAGQVRTPRLSYYLITSQADNSITYTDSQLRSMGFRVYQVSDCELMITAADDMADKVHLFVPSCHVPPPVSRRAITVN